MSPTAVRLPPAHKELTVLPCVIRPDGQYERSYPGAPGVVGWTLFLHTAAAYAFHGDPVFANEPDAVRYMQKRYKVKTNLNRNDALAFNES
jgi:hypothetical protein